MLFFFKEWRETLAVFRIYLTTTELGLTLVKIIRTCTTNHTRQLFMKETNLMSDSHSGPAGGGNMRLFKIVGQAR